MLEIFEFIFQDFWHWTGTVVLVTVIVSPLIVYAEAKGSK